jgi:hypothetical protein
VEGREAAPSRRRESGGRECGAWEGDIESERAAPAWERVRETERGARLATSRGSERERDRDWAAAARLGEGGVNEKP